MKFNQTVLALLGVLWCGIVLTVQPAMAQTRINDEVIVEKDETIDKAVAFGHDVIVRGTVREDAVSIGGNVIVESTGRIRNNAVSLGGDVRVESGGSVRNDAVSIGGNIEVRPGGSIHGERVTKMFGPMEGIGEGMKTLFVLGPLGGFMGIFGSMLFSIIFIAKTLIALGFALLMTMLFPQGIERMAVTAQREMPKSFLIGFLGIVFVPLICLLLLVTLIGIPFIPLVILLVVLAYFVGRVGVALMIGRMLPNGMMRSAVANVVVGVLVIGLVSMIPFIGFFAGIAIKLLAIGAIILTRFGTMYSSGSSTFQAAAPAPGTNNAV